MQPILSLRDVSYSYHNLKGETPALSHINLQVTEGSFVAVVGPSGCGKSTLLSLIAGLLPPEDGEILYRGLSSRDYCADTALRIGYMLQRDHLFEWRTVYQNVILGLELTHSLSGENTDYVLKLLNDYGLYGFKDKKPSELSGGMRQRAALIRTMAIFSFLTNRSALWIFRPACQYLRTLHPLSEKQEKPRFSLHMIFRKQSHWRIMLSFSPDDPPA